MAGRVTKGDLLRQRIVEASLKLFADQGFRATTVQQIADEVGISKQRLLYHFSSKEELHRAVLETVADQWKELLPVLLGAAVRGGEMASRLAPLLDFLRNQPHAARYVMRDIISPEREAVNTMGQLVWPWVEQLAEEIRRGQQDGRFDRGGAAPLRGAHQPHDPDPRGGVPGGRPRRLPPAHPDGEGARPPHGRRAPPPVPRARGR